MPNETVSSLDARPSLRFSCAISMKSVFFSPKRVSWRFPPIEEWTTTRGTPEGSHTHRGTRWRNTEADGHRSRIHNGGITGRATRWCCHTEREGWRLGSTLDHTFCFTCPCPFTYKNKTKSVHQHRGWCIGVRRKGQGADSAPPHGRIGRNMHVQGTCPRTRQQPCPRRDNKKKIHRQAPPLSPQPPGLTATDAGKGLTCLGGQIVVEGPTISIQHHPVLCKEKQQ